MKLFFHLAPLALGISVLSSLPSASATAQETNCTNFWVNPNTGETECLGSNLPVTGETNAPANSSAAPSRSNPAQQQANPASGPSQGLQGTGSGTSSNFTQSFVGACSRMDVPGIAKDRQRSFCGCAAAEAQKLPQDQLVKFSGMSFDQLQEEPVLVNIATACMSHLL